MQDTNPARGAPQERGVYNFTPPSTPYLFQTPLAEMWVLAPKEKFFSFLHICSSFPLSKTGLKLKSSKIFFLDLKEI